MAGDDFPGTPGQFVNVQQDPGTPGQFVNAQQAHGTPGVFFQQGPGFNQGAENWPGSPGMMGKFAQYPMEVIGVEYVNIFSQLVDGIVRYFIVPSTQEGPFFPANSALTSIPLSDQTRNGLYFGDSCNLPIYTTNSARTLAYLLGPDSDGEFLILSKINNGFSLSNYNIDENPDFKISDQVVSNLLDFLKNVISCLDSPQVVIDRINSIDINALASQESAILLTLHNFIVDKPVGGREKVLNILNLLCSTVIPPEKANVELVDELAKALIVKMPDSLEKLTKLGPIIQWLIDKGASDEIAGMDYERYLAELQSKYSPRPST